MKDTRDMEAKYGLEGTYSYAQEMLNYETYKVLLEESILSIGLSLVAVAAVVFMITGSLPVTFLVVLSVVLVDYFLIALIYYWDLTFNTIIIVNIVIAIGLAVDYSAHIAHTYLIIQPPEGMSNKEKRIFKARKALSSMGSSVFHGGFSTFIAIFVLSPGKTYIFVVFFRLWFRPGVKLF